MNRRATDPGERMILRAEQRRPWRAGLSAVAVVVGAAIGGGLTLVPAAGAASLFAEQPGQPHRLNRAGVIEEAQAAIAPKAGDDITGMVSPQGQPRLASTPLTRDDLVKAQERPNDPLNPRDRR